MELTGGPGLGHLTYCTNIHPGEDWPAVLAALRRYLPAVKARLAPERPLGVGLRLAASAARALREPAALDELRGLLHDGDFYVFTLNGFPYGAFHGQRVKEGAYRPDWTQPERLAYTNTLADLLAELLPPAMNGSISTVPGTYKDWASQAVPAIVDHLLQHVAHLVALRERTGRTLVLALEPEPCCLLETVAETVAFFEGELFGAEAARRLGELSGLGPAAAQEALRTHLGVCYDVCHAAVEFEDPRASVEALRNAGISIAKLQLSCALAIPSVDRAALRALQPFDEPVYLHQVVQRRDGRLTRFTDLEPARAAFDPAPGTEWRIHFHVPIFREQLEVFSTTQPFLREILALHRERPLSEHLEVETYTWDVLPEQFRKVDADEAIARELAWVRDRLQG